MRQRPHNTTTQIEKTRNFKFKILYTTVNEHISTSAQHRRMGLGNPEHQMCAGLITHIIQTNLLPSCKTNFWSVTQINLVFAETLPKMMVDGKYIYTNRHVGLDYAVKSSGRSVWHAKNLNTTPTGIYHLYARAICRGEHDQYHKYTTRRQWSNKTWITNGKEKKSN